MLPRVTSQRRSDHSLGSIIQIRIQMTRKQKKNSRKSKRHSQYFPIKKKEGSMTPLATADQVHPPSDQAVSKVSTLVLMIYSAVALMVFSTSSSAHPEDGGGPRAMISCTVTQYHSKSQWMAQRMR